MAVELTPLGKAVVFTGKWILVPLCAAFIGYVLIGPNIGGKIVRKIRSLPGIGSALGSEQNEPSEPKGSNERAKQFQSVRGIGQ
jgi:hypothetical protein